MKTAVLMSLACIRLLEAQVSSNLVIAPTSVSGFGANPFFRFRQADGKYIDFRFPNGTTGGITTSYTMTLPPAQAAAGGQFLFNDGTGVLSWATVTSGGGGGVTAVTASTPLASTGGSTPNISCANCMVTNATNIPTGAYDLGSTGNWWNSMYSGTFQVPVSGCANAAYVSGTSLFGGQIFIKNGSCVVQAQMDSNGFDTVGTVGNYKVQGVTVIDPSRNATVNNLTILGTCIGCPSGGGGSVSTVTASAPILSSGGSSPNISCPTCMKQGNSDVNVPGFNVEIGTSSNWIYRTYSQSFYSPNGICSDAASITSTALLGGQIFIKNGSCAVQARLDSNGFDTVGTIGVYKIQGTTVIDASRNAAFVSISGSSVSTTGNISAGGAFMHSGFTGNTKTITLSGCTMTFSGGILIGNSGC